MTTTTTTRRTLPPLPLPLPSPVRQASVSKRCCGWQLCCWSSSNAGRSPSSIDAPAGTLPPPGFCPSSACDPPGRHEIGADETGGESQLAGTNVGGWLRPGSYSNANTFPFPSPPLSLSLLPFSSNRLVATKEGEGRLKTPRWCGKSRGSRVWASLGLSGPVR